MPLVNEQYWVKRFGEASPCWSGDKYLDWEHGVICRRVCRRIFPRHVNLKVLDVGCGDGRWSAWMHKAFCVPVVGVDALEWPGVRENIQFRKVDAEGLADSDFVHDYGPELVVFWNSLTCVSNWREAVMAACRVAPRVLAFDNFQHPTPPWWKDLPHRKPISSVELMTEFYSDGFDLKDWVTGDVFHRRLFLATPKWLHPIIAPVSAVGDLAAQVFVYPHKARHSALLFEKR